MFASLAALQDTQAARAAGLSSEIQDPASGGAALEALRQRNALLDALFYDVSVITQAEAQAISPWLAREGALLYALARSDGPELPIARDTRIVTVSAVIAMPPAFTDIVDVMGEWDWFGALNSRAGIPVDVRVAQAWHHTNTELPYHLPVTETFKALL